MSNSGKFQLVLAVLLISLVKRAYGSSSAESNSPCGFRDSSHNADQATNQISNTNRSKNYEDQPCRSETLTKPKYRMSGAIDGATPYTSESLLQLSLNDQKAMWTSPFHLRPEDERPLVLWATGMFALTATDSKVMRHVGNTPVAHANGFSNYGVAALTATATSFYLSGTVRNDLHSRETGFLAGEAATNGVIVAEAMKFVFGRARPDERDAGSFRAGGASFPSEHAVAAWSIASVIAQEYPGPLTKLVAYGTASGISVARVAARQHFPSDVVVGSAVGYLIGHYVYRTHHDPELPGVSFGNSEKDFNEKTSRPRSPSEFASPSVPLDSWIYAAFDRLTALGYAPSAYANLRPWTRMECARIIAAARDELHIADVMEDSRANILWIDGTGGYVPPMKAPSIQRRSEAYGLYKALAAEFANDLERHDGSNSSEIRLDSLYTRYLGIAGTPLDDGYHFGQTLLNDFGRLYGAGPNVVSGASAWGSKGSVAFYVRGEYQHAAALTPYSQPVQQMIGNIDVTPPQDPIHTNVVDRFRLLDAYVAWNFKTLQISAGRQSLWWGPGAGGPTNMSDNAEPLDMVRVTNPSPWRLPGLLHWLGPVRWDTFFGLMAGHRYPALPAIDGQKISFKPTQNLEFGFSRTVLFRPITARMFSRGFFSFGDNPTTTPGSRTDVGDRRSGFDFSYRIPGLRNWLVLYNDGMADDETSPLAYPQMSLMNPGIYLPQIPGVQKLDFRAEMAWSDPPALSNRAGKYVYYNGAYHDAYTNDGHLFGSWVGREGHGLQLWGTYWFNPRNSVQAGYRKAHVDRDFIPSGGGIRDFFIRTAFQLRPGMEIGTFLQYEQWSFPVLSPLSGPNTVASIEFTYRPELRKELNVR